MDGWMMDGCWMDGWMDAGMNKWIDKRHKEELKKLDWVLEMSPSLIH